MSKDDSYDNSYLRKVAKKRSHEDLFTVNEKKGIDFAKLGVPILIVLLLGVIAYLIYKNNNQAQNQTQTTIALSDDNTQQVASKTTQPATISLDETANNSSDNTDNAIATEGGEADEKSNLQVAKDTTQAIKQAIPADKKMNDDDLEKIAAMVVSQLKKQEKSTNQLAKSLGNAEVDTIGISSQQSVSSSPEEGDKTSHYNKVTVNKNTNNVDKEISAMYDKNKKSSYIKSTGSELDTRKGEMRYHTVRKSETLSGISELVYGNAKYFDKIFEANPDILRNANMIYIGQKLRVPE